MGIDVMNDNKKQAGIAIGSAVGFTAGILVLGFNFPLLAIWIAVGALLGGSLAFLLSQFKKKNNERKAKINRN
jgi:uncharacterized membrane protein YccC